MPCRRAGGGFNGDPASLACDSIILIVLLRAQVNEPLDEVESQALLQPFIDAFHRHSDQMCQVARFAAASSSDAKSKRT